MKTKSDKESFAAGKNNWFLESSSLPEPRFVQAQLKKSLEVYGLFLIRTTPKPDSPELKNELKTYLKSFGQLLNQSPEGCDVFEVKNEGFEPGHPKFRGPSSNRRLTFHTDRCDTIVFYCVNPADSGGINQFVKAHTVYKNLEQESPILLEQLCQPFIYKRHNADPDNPLKTYELPVFDKVDQTVFVTLMTYLIEKAANDPELPNLTTQQKEALEEFQKICERSENQLEIKLEAGDLLFLDNTRMLHSRTSFTDVENKRLYYRFWITHAWSPDLPKSFKVLFGSSKAGTERGGFKKLNQ
ncbi:MAG: TauD/TfdA family dioxygenase [Lentisphaeraceae bacterium]|nr:TauD/TfdA family dioxygenase [Lentisphaeraceae bacterium]